MCALVEGDIKAIMEVHHGNANSAGLLASFSTFFMFVYDEEDADH